MVPGGASNWASVLGRSHPERAGDARALLRMVAFRHLILIWRLLCWPAAMWPGGEANKSPGVLAGARLNCEVKTCGNV